MSILSITGGKSLSRKLGKLPSAITAEVAKAVFEAGNDLRNSIIDSMREAKTGITYTRKSVSHTASASDEPPGIDLGNLVNSIQAIPSNKGLSISIGINDISQAKYGEYLEFGTQNMEPRPWLQPAFDFVAPKATKKIEKAVKSVLRGISK